MKKHHIYGPSSLDGLSKCVRFQYAPRDEGDTSGEEGTMLHEAYETGDTTGLDDEQKRSVELVSSFTQSLKFSDATSPEDWDEAREVEVGLNDLTYGTADCVLLCRKTRTCIVLDAKFTRIESDHDMQLRTYGACVVEMNPGEFDIVKTIVVAPRLGEPIVKTYLADALLEQMRKDIESLYTKVENPFTPPTPDEETCGRCRWAGECPALRGEIARVTRAMGLPLPEQFGIDGDISPRDRAVSQVLRGIFTAWGDAVSKKNTEFLNNGGDIPGFRLQTRSNGLKVPKKDTKDAVHALMSIGLPEDMIMECCNLTLGELGKRASTIFGGTQASAKEQIREALSGMTVESISMFPQKTNRISNENLLAELTVS